MQSGQPNCATTAVPYLSSCTVVIPFDDGLAAPVPSHRWILHIINPDDALGIQAWTWAPIKCLMASRPHCITLFQTSELGTYKALPKLNLFTVIYKYCSRAVGCASASPKLCCLLPAAYKCRFYCSISRSAIAIYSSVWTSPHIKKESPNALLPINIFPTIKPPSSLPPFIFPSRISL